MVDVQCSVCQKKFSTQACWIKRVKEPMCSRTCNGKRRWMKTLRHAGFRNPKGTLPPAAGREGSENYAWKGGVTFKRNKGNYIGPKYVRCPVEFLAMARTDGYVMEHRLVMAVQLGRCLQRVEVVHHIDHNTRNNAPDNLELFPNNAAHKRAEGQRKRLARSAVAQGHGTGGARR